MSPNFVPTRDRAVSVATTDTALTEDVLRARFVGREAYRHTRFLAVRHDDATALVRVGHEDPGPLFSPITELDLLVGADDCAWVEDQTVDTSVPSQLAAAAERHAPTARGVVVSGRYGHVGFIVDPQPLVLHVLDVVPPEPGKLLDQVRRVLDTAEDLPPVVVRPELLDLRDLARSRPSATYLLPCRAGEATIPDRRTCFLDERPPREDWVLVGCARSREVHRWFYGDVPSNVDSCPRERARPGTATLTKCCLLDEGVEEDRAGVTVPWGASLLEVRAALERLLRANGVVWAPD